MQRKMHFFFKILVYIKKINIWYFRHALIDKPTRNSPKVRSHICANNKDFPQKTQINLIFCLKTLCMSNICSTFAAAKAQTGSRGQKWRGKV